MRRIYPIIGVLACLFITVSAMATQGSVQPVTITFDPDSLIQAYPSVDQTGEYKDVQLDARRLHQPWATQWYETFTNRNPAYVKSQPDSYNTYMNWRDSLGAGEGIACFNTWYLGNDAVRSWGETIVMKPGTDVTATTANGWNYRIIDNPYALNGKSVQWWTTDSSKYINISSKTDSFSLTAELYWDNNANGWDASDIAVVAGDNVRFWLGNINGDEQDFYINNIDPLHYDGAIYGTGVNTLGSGFEAALNVTAATPVPLPSAVWPGLAMLGALLAGHLFRRYRISRP